MNPRLKKIIEEIEKTKKRVSEQQSRLRELERQKIEVENTDIVAMVRGLDVTPDNLKELIALFQQQNVLAKDTIIKGEEAIKNEE